MKESDQLLKWQDCLELIRGNVGESLFDAWFKCAKAVSFADNTLTISLPSQFFYDQYEDRFYKVLRFALHRVYGQDVKIAYHIPVIQGDEDSSVKIASSSKSNAINDQQPEVTYQDFDSNLNPRYNLENYLVGRSNKLVHTIAEYISENPNKTEFNPFFLYGSVGVGKTHLIQAIGIRIKEKFPRANVLYVTMRRFINEYATHTMKKKVPDFINWYQHLDVLLLDDLQELSGKEGTMNALYPIFNHLHQNGRKLIFTCDRPPVQLEGITDRLIDRFKWGITEELPKPDYELRKKILKFKSQTNGLSLPDPIIEMIAEKATGSIRELEGIVMGIITRCIMLNCPITEQLAREEIEKSVKTVHKQINFDMIVEVTADKYNLNPDVIYSSSRVRDIADARQVIMYLAHKHTNLSTPAIGSRLNRKHTTVLHGIRNISDRLSVEKDFVSVIDSIERILES